MRSAFVILVFALVFAATAAAQKPVPPKPFPEYMTGDECLFCHRAVGDTWQGNAHTITVRAREGVVKLERALGKVPADVTHYLGGRNYLRLLKKNGYGRMDMLSLPAIPKGEEIKPKSLAAAAWDKNKFQDRCSGCHMTAVDSVTRQYTAPAHDCFTCHGVTPPEHTRDQQTVFLAKARLKAGTDSARVTISICAQCHLRGGKSRTTGLPYPYNFVPGEDLFKDYEVDFSKAEDKSLNPGDRHVYHNVRDVVLKGETKMTCMNCHQLHKDGTARHWIAFQRAGSDPPICFDCHSASGKYTPGYAVHSALCEY